MKKILIAGLCACALLAISCGTTGNVAENNPQTHSAPNAENNPQITQMDTDERTQNGQADSSAQLNTTESEEQADTQTDGYGGTTIGNAGGDGGIQILGTQTATAPTDETETTSTQPEQTNADEETDGFSPLVTRERDEDFEIIAEADVLQNEPNADESSVASTRLTEPEIFDEPDPNATNTLAETAPDAEGTTPLQQTTVALPTAAGTVATAETPAQPTTNAAADTTRTATESTAPRATPAVQQERATPAQSTQNASTANARTNAPLSTRAQTATNTVETTAGRQTATRAHDATTTTAQTANQSAQNTTNTTAPTAQSASAPARDTAQAEQTATDASELTDESDALIPLEKQTVIPSRSVTIKNNQYLDVVYPGSGWVYLGEAEENRDQKKQPIFSYFGRKLGTTDTTFTLRSRKPGTTLLHFYKNDALTGQYIDDYLAVTVESENAKAGVRATAPAYAEVVPPKPSRQTRQSYENVVSTGNEIVGSSPTMTHANAATTNVNAATTNANAAATNADATATRSAQSGANVSSAQTAQGADTTAASTAQSTAAVPVAEDRGVKTVIQTTESAPNGEAKSLATAPAYSGTTNTATNGTAQTTTQSAAGESDLDLLEQAKRSYATKQYETALDQVQRYLDDATSKIDEALFLQGQVLEAESSVKSIRSAIDSYESLTKNYPMSSLWGKANNRIIYLKRFYIEIR